MEREMDGSLPPPQGQPSLLRKKGLNWRILGPPVWTLIPEGWSSAWGFQCNEVPRVNHFSEV